MFKNSLSLALVLVGVVCARPAYSMQESESRRAAKVKAEVAKLGVGEKARVEVSMMNRTKLKGYVKEAGEEDFVVVDKSGAEVRVPYSQVRRMKGRGLGTGVRVALGVAGVFGVITLVGLLLAVADKR